jgi:hypothetical protein
MLQFHLSPPDWPFDLTNLDAATEFYRRQCADNSGVMLSMERTSAAGGEALRGLFKYRAPVPGSLAMYYVGILWLPFQECTFQVNIEAMETGTTGVREAAVMVMAGDSWPMPQQQEIPVINSEEDLQALYLAAEVIATATLEASARGLTPFRVKPR